MIQEPKTWWRVGAETVTLSPILSLSFGNLLKNPDLTSHHRLTESEIVALGTCDASVSWASHSDAYQASWNTVRRACSSIEQFTIFHIHIQSALNICQLKWKILWLSNFRIYNYDQISFFSAPPQPNQPDIMLKRNVNLMQNLLLK